ncbi:MAG: hypothetical protein Q9208_007521 [Pyrenodesmia sp. 3 TL-2023]
MNYNLLQDRLNLKPRLEGKANGLAGEIDDTLKVFFKDNLIRPDEDAMVSWRGDLRKVFIAALELKVQTSLAPQAFGFKWFDPDEPFDSKRMSMIRDYPTTRTEFLRFTLFPGLVRINESSEGFPLPAEEVPISKALVLRQAPVAAEPIKSPSLYAQPPAIGFWRPTACALVSHVVKLSGAIPQERTCAPVFYSLKKLLTPIHARLWISVMGDGMHNVQPSTSPWLYRWILLCMAGLLTTTLALPATDLTSTSNRALSQSPPLNSTTNNLSLPPWAFQIHTDYIPDYPPMHIPSIYLNLINVAYLNSRYGFRKTWQGPQSPAPLPGYPVGVSFAPPSEDPTRTVSNRFVMWGLWETAIGIYRDRKFTPCLVALFWHKEPVGGILLQTTDQMMPTAAAEDDAGPEEEDVVTHMNLTDEASTTKAPSPLKAPSLRILYEFGSHTLSSLDLFLAAFPVLSLVADTGADYQCEELKQHGYDTPNRVSFAIEAVKDARGNVKLKYGHVREVVKVTIFGAVEAKLFRNMRFRVELDGEVIAKGTWMRDAVSGDAAAAAAVASA